MASIPYHAKDCQQPPGESPKGTVSEPDADLIGQFYAEAKREIVKGDYLRRKWQPLCGHRFYVLVKAIRGYCSYDIREGEAMCFPSEETLAREIGVTRRTIINWLDRVKEGEEEKYPDLKVGDFCHKRHGKALQQFLRIVPQRRYSPKDHCSVKAVHHYFVRMDDPPVPEDIPLIWARARELAISYLESQSQEQEREARCQEFEARAARSASSGPEDFTHNNVKNFHSQQCEKNAQNPLSSTSHITLDSIRSTQGEELAAQAIRNTETVTNNQANKGKNERYVDSATQASKSNSATAQRSEDPFRRAAPLAEGGEEPDGSALEAARDLLASVFREYGDFAATAKLSARGWVRKLVEAGVPGAQLVALIELACRRVERSKERCRVIRDAARYFTRTMENAVKEARIKGWNIAQMEAVDRRNHQKALRTQGQVAQPQPSAPPRPARRVHRRPTPPTSAEVEELVIELGQQEETYAEAQAQLRQMEEARAERETHRRAAQAQEAAAPRDWRARQIWQSVLERIQPQVSQAIFNTWLRGTQAISLHGQVLTVRVKTTFDAAHLERCFSNLVCSILSDLVGPAAEVQFEVEQTQEAQEIQKEAVTRVDNTPAPDPQAHPIWRPEWESLEYREQVVQMAKVLGWPDMWGTLADKEADWRENRWRQFLLDGATTAQEAAEAYAWLRPQFQVCNHGESDKRG